MEPSSDSRQEVKAPEIIALLSLKELAAILVRHKELHEGLYDVSMEFQIAVGAIGPSPDAVLPGAMVGISRIGLSKVEQMGPQTVDAAMLNPAKKPHPRKTKVTK